MDRRADGEGGAKDANDDSGGVAEKQHSVAAGGNDEGVLQSTKTRMIAAAGTLLSGHCCQLRRDWRNVCIFYFSGAPQSFRQNGFVGTTCR